MHSQRSALIKRLRIAIVLLFVGVISAGYLVGRRLVDANPRSAFASPTPVKRTRASQLTKYSAFPHNVKAHQVECNSCHKFPSDNWNKVRSKADAFPDITEYPRHETCLNCHRQQFFRGSVPPICTICHTNPGPRNSTRHPFPNPREIFDTSQKGKTAVSDFAISFPHSKHVDAGEESCSQCHQTLQAQGESPEEFVTAQPANWGDKFWLKKGTFKSTPISHQTCFMCHSSDTGIAPEPSNCAACHKLRPAEARSDFDAKLASTMKITDKVTLDSWRRRDSSGKFRHEWTSHAELACSTCHSVEKINTLDAATKKVSISSCSMCHVTTTAAEGGALNAELESRRSNPKFECIKCHITFGKLPVPDSHLKALAGGMAKLR